MKKNQLPSLAFKSLFIAKVFHLIRYTVFLASFVLLAQIGFGQDDPDMPGFLKNKISPEEFMRLRSEAIGMRRGIEKGKLFDPSKRSQAIEQMKQQKNRLSASPNALQRNTALASWTELGPKPIPNGQVVGNIQTPVSGRTISIAVHPTNPNIVYVGTAQGGLYRSIDGGATWVPLMDNAKSLAIGAIAISPSQPETIYVGTGEQSFSGDSFFGVGVYRIDNASSASPTLTGPLNKDGSNADVFTGRAIGQILVHPLNPDIIFVATTSGIGGIGPTTPSPLPSRGIYRSTNATSATPVFAKLTGLASGQNFSVRDMILDPLNPDLLVCDVVAASGLGGIYVTTAALSATPAFTQQLILNGSSASQLTAEFAIQHTIGVTNPTIYAATGNGLSTTPSSGKFGKVFINTDGGTTWTQQILNGFCGGQCFYDIAVAVDPTNATKVYLGGTGDNTTFAYSTNSGTSFTSSAIGLHTDSHVISVSPSSPSTIYFGSDGGIYKSVDAGITWSSLNNSTFRATQFQSLALHPTDPNFTIGGTQDNGTEFYKPDGTWTRADFGDGGFSAIDQNAANNTNVTMYHTYFNQTNSLIGFSRTLTTTCATEGQWPFKGIYGGAVDPTPYSCDGSTDSFNGISISDPVLFYAPLVLGPGNPNTVYFGTNKLYRSANKGDVMPAVSQAVSGNPISAIGISPQDDNVRIVGVSDGGLFGTTTGANPLTNLDPSNTVPDKYIARAVIDPNNINTAYVTLSAFGFVNVWKTINLNNATPTWTSAASGIPLVPVNAFVVDPANSNNLYAGTDIGVYASTDAGATWVPFGTGLPIVAVFGMAIQPVSHVLRIATHGRGMWEIPSNSSATIVAGAVTGTITACQGTPSSSPNIQQFTVSGSSLSADILVNAPANFEISTSAGSGYGVSLTLTQLSGNVSSTIIYVRSSSSATAGAISGNVTITTTGASTVNVPVSGTVNSIPTTPTITAGGPTSFCTSGSVTLTSSSTSGNQWYLDGGAISGATANTYVASVAGNYTVKVTTSGCTSAASAITIVTVNSIPSTPTITAGGPTSFYTGGSVTLTSSSTSGNQWYLDGGAISGATANTYVASVAGNYTVKVTTSGCTSAASAITIVTVNPIPSTGKVFVCHKGKTLLISSASIQDHLSHGDYLGKCVANPVTRTQIDTTNVSAVNSAALTIETSQKGINSENFKVIVTPNPSASNFLFRVESNSNESITIRVTDALGRLVNTITNKQKSTLIILSKNYRGGNYFAEVVQGANRKVVKLIKTN